MRTLPDAFAAARSSSGSGAAVRSMYMLYVKTSARMVTKLLSVALFLKRKGSPFANASSRRFPGGGGRGASEGWLVKARKPSRSGSRTSEGRNSRRSSMAQE